ncbi:MAG TPA: hypothetical protein VFT21_01490, partial [Gemmatimonadaceae bacterium]|nr:hypothetical protein [Gemmatimonadaceae bacterium]
RKSPKLQLTYGARLETSAYPDAPAFNPALDSAFGVRTDRFPSESHLSPRVGFTYTYGAASNGPALGSIRGGFGEFRARASSSLFASAADANGLASGQSQIVCVGPTVPTPDWAGFINDPSTVPATCNGASQQFGNERRNVTVFSDDFAAPRAWRGSIGMNRRFAERYNLSLDASFARGVSQTSARDMNLDTTPKFTLANEANRPVYAPVTSIVPASGAVSLTGSRLVPRFGVVSQINSDLESSTKQLTASFNGVTTKAILFNASYTYTRSTDQSQGISTFGGGGGFGGGSGASTAGNPNLAERGTSDQERRHSLIGTVTWPIKPYFELTAISRLTSGGFFTPIVGGDVNGDGLRNDRPFVFDPAGTADTAVKNGMSRLLAAAPARARECLESQMGAIASRNSCSVPWTPSFDMQANFKPNFWGLNRKLTISVLGLNTLTGIDQLLHGNDNLHGWGQPVFPDRTLLYVRGFNAATNQFKYQVNEHFGAANGSRNAFRVPFQLAVQARLTLGVDPARQQMNAVFGGRGGRASVADFRERLARAVPNPFRQILEVNDSAGLLLTADQKAKLALLGDSLQVKADTLVGSLAQTLGGNEARNADPLQLGMRMRGRIQEGRALATKALKDAEGVLTPEQWAKVPKSIKEPFQRPGGGGFGPGGDRGPPL